MMLADRLNQIIQEQNISKREFAKRLGISWNYVYILTGRTNKISTITPALAKLISLEFGYDLNWILDGKDECEETESIQRD